jgi:hypothetical protein
MSQVKQTANSFDRKTYEYFRSKKAPRPEKGPRIKQSWVNPKRNFLPGTNGPSIKFSYKNPGTKPVYKKIPTLEKEKKKTKIETKKEIEFPKESIAKTFFGRRIKQRDFYNPSSSTKKRFY